MKNNINILKLIFSIFFLLSVTAGIFAQYTPNEINYQGVARDAKGEPICKTDIQVVFSILRNSANGTIDYSERQTITTNEFGLFSAPIGTGSWVAGLYQNLESVDWGCCSHYLKVELVINNSNKIVGSTQLYSVPYAMYAAKAGEGVFVIDDLAFNTATNKLSYKGNDKIDLSPLKQELIYDPVNSHLTISGMPGVIDLSVFKHPPQDLRIDNDKLNITGNTEATIVDLKPYKQTLTLTTDGKVSISNGNSVSIDTSAVNEIQDLSLTANALKITKNANAAVIDLSKYLDDTDKQTLSRAGSNLSISNGNSVDVSDMINLTWVGFSGNNLSTQALLGSAETLITWSEEFDSGNVLDNNKFSAPSNGYYNFAFNFIFSADSYLEVRVYKNSSVLRTFNSFGKTLSHNMLLSLTASDIISIKVYNSDSTPIYVKSGYFSGYRVN